MLPQLNISLLGNVKSKMGHCAMRYTQAYSHSTRRKPHREQLNSTLSESGMYSCTLLIRSKQFNPSYPHPISKAEVTLYTGIIPLNIYMQLHMIGLLILYIFGACTHKHTQPESSDHIHPIIRLWYLLVCIFLRTGELPREKSL